LRRCLRSIGEEKLQVNVRVPLSQKAEDLYQRLARKGGRLRSAVTIIVSEIGPWRKKKFRGGWKNHNLVWHHANIAKILSKKGNMVAGLKKVGETSDRAWGW